MAQSSPYGLETFMRAEAYGITALLALMIWWASGRAGLTGNRRTIAWLVAMALLVAWQQLGEVLARAGVFVTGPESPASWMGAAIPLPVILGLAAIAASPTARRIVEATPSWALVAIQFYRVIGAVFLVLWAGGRLPGAFALPAGLGDLATGLAAPVVAYAVARWPERRRTVMLWNAFGLADLIVAITTAILTAPGLGQMLAFDAPNRLIFSYPLALVPLYGVPVAFILHGLVWQRLARTAPHSAAHLAAE